MTEEILSKLKKINNNLSCEKIGVELGVTGQTVWRWLNGKNTPSNLASEKIRAFVAKR